MQQDAVEQAALQLLQALGEFKDGMARVADSAAYAERLLQLADTVRNVLDEWSRNAVLKTMVLEMADQMVELNRQIAVASRRAGGSLPAARACHVATQLRAACNVLQTCARVGCELELSPRELTRLSAACQLVFESGQQAVTATVAAYREALDAPTPPSSRGQRQQLRALLNLAGVQLASAGITMHDMLQRSQQPQAIAAFAAAAKPARVVAWLQAVSEALTLISRTEPISSADRFNFAAVLEVLLTEEPYSKHAATLQADTRAADAVLEVLLCILLPPIAAGAASGELLAQLRDHGSGSERNDPFVGHSNMLVVAKFALRAPAMEAALLRRMQRPGAAGLVQQAGDVVWCLPAPQPAEGVDPQRFRAARSAASEVLAVLAERLAATDLPPERALQYPGASAANGGSSAGSRGGGGGSRKKASQARKLRGKAASGSSDGGGSSSHSGGSSKEQVEAAWAVVRLVPHIAASLQEAAAEGSGYSQEALAHLCNDATATINILHSLKYTSPTPDELKAWAAAAEAGMRLLPLLAELGRRWQKEQGRAAQPVYASADGLADQLLCVLWAGMPTGAAAAAAPLQSGPAGAAALPAGAAALLAPADPAGTASPAAAGSGAAGPTEPPQPAAAAADPALTKGTLPSRLWRLHSTSCRLMHWLAAGHGPEELAGHSRDHPGTWWWLQRCLHGTFLAAHAAMQPAEAREQPQMGPAAAARPTPAVGALCAAHLEAIAATAPTEHVGIIQCCDNPRCPHNPYSLAPAVLDAVVKVAAACPEAVGPALEQPLLHALSWAATASELPRDVGAQLQRRLARAAAECPRLAVVVASSGLLKETVSYAVNKRGEDFYGDIEEAYAAIAAMQKAAQHAGSSLLAAGSSSGGSDGSQGSSSGSQGSQGGQPAELEQAQQRAALALRLLDSSSQLQKILADAGWSEELGAWEPEEETDSDDEVDGEGSGQGEGEQQGQGSGSSSSDGGADPWQWLMDTPKAIEAVCAALQQYYALPEQRAAAAAELAQAAAARSCAHLRCSNVALEGGPAAGQGRGCKRCGACRSASYCGPACSKADWKLRHKLVCSRAAVVS